MGEKTIKAGTDLVKILVDNGKGSEVILQKLSDLFPAILFIYNTEDEKISFLNNKISSILGYTVQDLSKINNDLFSFISPDDRPIVAEAISHFREQEEMETLSINCHLITRDGSPVLYKIEGQVVDKNLQNKPYNILFTASQLTNQPAYNEDILNFKSLMHENERLLKYGTWEYNFATESIHWSDGMYLLFGYDPVKDRERLKVDEDIYFKHMDPSQVKTMLEKRKMFLEKNINEYTWEYEIFTNDKAQKRIESYSRLIRDENGNPTQIIGTSRDISRLRDYERSLEEKVKDLDRSNKELEEFAYIASHDLQEPLRKLTTFSERLQQKFSDRLDDDGNAYINRMLNATSNMRMLIDNLLEYSRTTSSAVVAEKCSLNIVVNKALSDLELPIEETNTKVEVGKLPDITCIPGQLSQLFINIIGNAIKFRMPDKQPIIKIQSRKLIAKEISYHMLDESKNWHQVTISDNGIGFEEEYSRKIFQIFQRLHSKAEYPGTGIGLSICKKIVDHHKGVIYAEGKPMQGATFTIILPETP